MPHVNLEIQESRWLIPKKSKCLSTACKLFDEMPHRAPTPKSGVEEPSGVDPGKSKDSNSLSGGVVSDSGNVINLDEAWRVGRDDRRLEQKLMKWCPLRYLAKK